MRTFCFQFAQVKRKNQLTFFSLVLEGRRSRPEERTHHSRVLLFVYPLPPPPAKTYRWESIHCDLGEMERVVTQVTE